jgi:serine/threonine protein kinase/tetratricopeptide (TPR) repeat protein
MGPQTKPDRVEAVNQIFCEALELPSSEQAGFVRQRCREDSDLGDSVLRLLSRYGRLGDFLQEPPCAGMRAVHQLSPGEILCGRFHIVSRLGSGGMGEVYRAEDAVSQETVALKILRPDAGEGEELAERFRAEIRLARRISHPNICRVNELFVEPRGSSQLLLFTMEFLNGPTLAAHVSKGPSPAAECLKVAHQIAAGLDAAHQAGIIHRDLKPANILLVSESDGAVRVVITDFGLAHSLRGTASGSQTAAGQILGTPDYMAPEQFLASKVSPQTDLFAFAMLFFEMAAGCRPFPAEDPLRSAIRRVLGPSEPLSRYTPDAPKHWTAVLQRALSPDPAVRPRSAGALVRQLESTPGWSRRTLLWPVGAIGLSAIAISARYWKWGTVSFPERPLLMLTSTQPSPDVTGHAGPALDVLLGSQLQQSSQVQILSHDRIEHAWQRIHASSAKLPARLDPLDARHIALREGAQFVLFGAVSKVSDEYRLDLNLDLLGGSATEPRKTFRQTFTAKREMDLPAAAFDGATWIRATLKESERDLNRRNRVPAELTTSSWQALQEYGQSVEARSGDDPNGALQHLHAALELDPEFALANARLGDLLVSLHRYDEGLPYYSRAAETVARKNLTDRESLQIRGLFALDSGRLAEADAVFARWCAEYPEDGIGYFYRSTSTDLLDFEEQALDLAQRALDRGPAAYAYLVRRAVLLLDAGRTDEAEALYPRAAALKPSDWTDQFRAALRFNRFDMAGVEQALENMSAHGSPAYRSRAVNFKSCLRAEQNRWTDAESLLHSGIVLDERMGADGLDAKFTKQRLLVQILLSEGRTKESTGLCEAMLADRIGYREKMQLGCLLAQAGNVRLAQACYVNGLPDWPVYTHWQKRLEGEISLAKGDGRRALQSMQEAGPPALKNEWRWYLVRAAEAAGDHSVTLANVRALVQNPGRYWVQADAAGPGFISWALGRAAGLPLSPTDSESARALRKLLQDSN